MKHINNKRREAFGGILYSENPGFTLFVNHKLADKLQISKTSHTHEEILSAPLDVHLSLTEKCNFKCDGCYSAKSDSKQHEIDFLLAKKIIDRLSELNVFTVSFGGGEPFLYTKLYELAEYTRNRGIAPNITTNGSLINDDTVSICKIFSNIHLSYHSENDVEVLDQALQILRKNKIIPGLNLLLTKSNFNNFDRILKWAAVHKLSNVLFLRYKLTENNKNRTDLLLSDDEKKSFYLTMQKLSKKYKMNPIIDCSSFPLLAFHNVKHKLLKKFDMNGCLGGNYYLAIDIHGNYKPCSFYNKTFGSFLELDYDKWIHDNELNNFRKPKINHHYCHKCHYLDLCNYGCRIIKNEICSYFPA